MQFEIQEPRTIPFYGGDKKLGEAVKSAGARRNMGPLRFAFRKIKNIILARLSYFCPLNGWRVKMNRWRGVHIGKNVYIGMYCVIDNAYPEYVYIEDNVSLAGEVRVIVETDVDLRLQYSAVPPLCRCLVGDIATYAVYRFTARNRFGTGLPLLLSNVLS